MAKSKIKFPNFPRNFRDWYLLVFLLPLIINPWGFTFYEAPKIFYLRVFISIALTCTMFFFWRRGGLTIFWNKIVFLLGIGWLASLMLSTVFSIAPQLSFWGSYDRIQGLLSHIFYMLHFAILVQYLQKNSAKEKVFMWIFYVGLIVSLYGIAQKFGFTLFTGEANKEFLGRVFSTLGQPNFLGQFLIFPIWTGVRLLKKNSYSLKYILGLAVLATALILSENRASILGLLISLGIYLSFASEKIHKHRIKVWAGIAILFVLFITVIAPSTRSLQSRFLIWKSVLPLISQNPIVGSGPETLYLTFPTVYTPELAYYEQVNDIADRAHNEPLDILIAQGIIGLVIYLTVIILIIQGTVKKPHLLKDPVFLTTFCAFLATLVTNLYSFQLTSNFLIFYLLLAMLATYLCKFKKVELPANFFTVFVSGILVTLLAFNLVQAHNFILADNSFGKGIENLDKKKYREAVKNLAEANQINPHQGYINFLTGHFFINIGATIADPLLLNTAEALLDQSTNFYGKNYDYYIEMGQLNIALNNYQAANQAFESAHKIAPNYTGALFYWGKLLFENQDYPQAAEKFEQYLKLLPNYWQWTPILKTKSLEEQEKYRIFLKNTPELTEAIKELKESYKAINKKSGLF